MNDAQNQEKSPLIELTGLWENKDRNGNTYLSGNMSPSARIMIFKNNYKQNEREPDYRLCIAKRSFDDRNSDSSNTGGGIGSSNNSGPQANDSSTDDGIPF